MLKYYKIKQIDIINKTKRETLLLIPKRDLEVKTENTIKMIEREVQAKKEDIERLPPAMKEREARVKKEKHKIKVAAKTEIERKAQVETEKGKKTEIEIEKEKEVKVEIERKSNKRDLNLLQEHFQGHQYQLRSINVKTKSMIRKEIEVEVKKRRIPKRIERENKP